MECQNIDALLAICQAEDGGALCQLTRWMVTVRFANSLGGWCLSWQSNCGSAPWSVAALPTHHTACWRSWQNLPLPASALCQLTRRMVFELAKQLRISTICQWRLCQLITPCAGESWQNLPLAGSALCQLIRRMVFELAKQLWISTVVSGGFANSSHRVLERVGKTYPCLTVRFANSLGGWCLSWQSNYGSAQWSVAALPTHHTACRGVGKT
ncbi:MAG: hypothetical protein IPN95_26035 [Bacteroidetes bacterium]|nr:hypothetical protein [Bacteroidota bacterium]